MYYCYNLISCNPLSYPDITNLCRKNPHPFDGQVVYINESPINPLETYTLTFVGLNTCVCNSWIPKLRVTTESSCVPVTEIFQYRNCEDPSIVRNFGFPVPPTNATLRKDGDCDCWTFVGEEAVADEILASYSEYDDCNECLSTRESELCPQGERTIGCAVRVNLPDSPPPDRGFSKCCYTNLVLADVSDDDEYKNDFSGVFFKRETQSSTVVFKLVDTF